MNRVGSGIVCGDDAKVIPVNKKVKYVAFVCTEYNGNMRVKEFELWTAENPDEPFVSENAFRHHSHILY